MTSPRKSVGMRMEQEHGERQHSQGQGQGHGHHSGGGAPASQAPETTGPVRASKNQEQPPPPESNVEPGASHQHQGPVPAEAKREEFRNYLERAGVLDALTRVLIGLYEEPDKPTNPMEYFLDQLSGGSPAKQELNSLQSDFGQLETRAAELEQENERLRADLERRDIDADEAERAAALSAAEELKAGGSVPATPLGSDTEGGGVVRAASAPTAATPGRSRPNSALKTSVKSSKTKA